MASLAGKVVIITGASSGIGEGTAKHFARLGSRLCLVGRSTENLEKVSECCTETGIASTEAITVAGDICKKDDRETIVSKTVDKFGKIDVLVNCAGTANYNTASNTTEAEYDEVFDTNLKAHVFLTQLAIPYLKQSKESLLYPDQTSFDWPTASLRHYYNGNIVNVSSICSTKPTPNMGIYSMSKAAMDMYTECLALDMAPFGVRVNAICPATVVSNIHRRPGKMCTDEETYNKFLEAQVNVHPLGRVGLPEDCAEAIAFLASDAASFISGQSIYIDGARHCLSATVATNIMKK